jgi:hypothetical protein
MGAVLAADAVRRPRTWLWGAGIAAALAGCSSGPVPQAVDDGGSPAPLDDAALTSQACEALDAAPPCVTPMPSFANDIFPMLNRDCNGACHIAGGVAWPLTDYQDVADWSLLIQIQIASCEMPPTDAGSLPSADRDALLNWIACGTPNN